MHNQPPILKVKSNKVTKYELFKINFFIISMFTLINRRGTGQIINTRDFLKTRCVRWSGSVDLPDQIPSTLFSPTSIGVKLTLA